MSILRRFDQSSASLSFLTWLGFFIVQIGRSERRLQNNQSDIIWIHDRNGNIPSNALFYKHHGLNIYFCRAENSVTGNSYIGSIVKGQLECEFAIIQDWIRSKGDNHVPEIKKNASYKVLTSQGTDVQKDILLWNWELHQLGTTFVPEGAIKCDTSGDGEGCYLGISVYADSICDESIGKINMELQFNKFTKKRYGLAYIIDYLKKDGVENSLSGKASTCPFFKFLIIR